MQVATDLRDLDDTSSKYDTQPQTLGQRILQTLGMCDVKVVDQDRIALLANEGDSRVSKDGWDVVRDRRDLHRSAWRIWVFACVCLAYS